MDREQLKQKAQSISKVPSHYQLMIEDYGEKYAKESRAFSPGRTLKSRNGTFLWS
ncbi:YcdB/YcdC domain-containing protein [Bacillus licheniformis]